MQSAYCLILGSQIILEMICYHVNFQQLWSKGQAKTSWSQNFVKTLKHSEFFDKYMTSSNTKKCSRCSESLEKCIRIDASNKASKLMLDWITYLVQGRRNWGCNWPPKFCHQYKLLTVPWKVLWLLHAQACTCTPKFSDRPPAL